MSDLFGKFVTVNAILENSYQNSSKYYADKIWIKKEIEPKTALICGFTNVYDGKIEVYFDNDDLFNNLSYKDFKKTKCHKCARVVFNPKNKPCLALLEDIEILNKEHK